jgi:hypothetical protein
MKESIGLKFILIYLKETMWRMAGAVMGGVSKVAAEEDAMDLIKLQGGPGTDAYLGATTTYATNV